MGYIDMLPELRTSGGEAISIYREGEWIGDLYLIYRENDLLTGSVHLDHMFVHADEVQDIADELRSYIKNLSYALNVADANVNIIYGSYSLLEDFDEEMDMDDELDDEEIYDAEDDEVTGYERWIVGQGNKGIEYQIYDDEKNLIAEAIVDIQGTTILGEINFTLEPGQEEMEDIEALLLKDYDHDLIDQYQFTYTVNGTEYEEFEFDDNIELREDLDDLAEAGVDMVEMLERQEDVDDYEQRERAKVVFDLVDKADKDLGVATFYYSEDGVDVNINLDVQPNEDIAHHIMKTVFREALTDPMEWVNIRMFHKGTVVDGFHFERGKEMQKGTI